MMGRLLSVNVGLPQDVTWRGKTVHTAIWKEPVEGRRMVRRLNLDGDGQGDLAGHGGERRAVFVYQIDSYRYWQNYLGRSDFTYGQFGENFTVDGLADIEVCIGDRYRIGGALRGDATARYVLPVGHSYERAGNGRASGQARETRLLFSCT
jgi:MOSC domain-containing protein YiiM